MFWNDYWWVVLLGILILPVICVLIFVFWIRSRKDITHEITAMYWGVFIKLISAFTIIVSGAMLFGKYIDQQEALQNLRQKEVNKELALKEATYLRLKLNYDSDRHVLALKLLGEARRLAAKLASEDSPEEESILRFEELYFADLIGIEKPGGNVVKAMVNFRKELMKDPKASDKSLSALALDLSEAVQIELDESQENLLSQHKEILNLVNPKE